MAPVFRFAVAAVVAAVTGTNAHAQTALKLHEAIAAPQRPMLCTDRGSVDLVTPVLARAAEARATRDPDKAQRLADIATRLQGEVCRTSSADDVVILRCKLAQINVGGSALTLVKLSAVVRNEAAKGEQSFYGWTDARVDDADSNPTTRDAQMRWCGGERAVPVEVADSGEPLKPTQDVVLRIQQRLYDFGIRIDNLDGQLNQETVRGLSQFQNFANLPADGQLTRATINRMMTTPAPSPWVAIAFDGSGNFAPEIGRTRRETEIAALERLQQRSGRDLKVSSVVAPNCIGFAVTRFTERGRRSRTNFTQAFTSAGDSMESAGRNAFDYCEREKGGGQCQVRYALCADGRGGTPQADDGNRKQRPDRNSEAPRFDRDSPPVNAPNPNAAPNKRVDPQNLPINAPRPRFDTNELPANAPNPNR